MFRSDQRHSTLLFRISNRKSARPAQNLPESKATRHVVGSIYIILWDNIYNNGTEIKKQG